MSQYQIPTFLTTKNPSDTSNWTRDFSGVLDVGDSIAQINSIQILPGDLTVLSSSLAVGNAGLNTAVEFNLSGGTIGFKYTITIAITTANGSQFSRQTYLNVSQM